MTRLDRYVGKSVLMATLVVILVIVGLDAIFTLVDELDQLKGAYGFVEALEFMALRLPRRAYEYMPMACLIGCLAGLGGLAASSEPREGPMEIIGSELLTPVGERIKT